MGVIGAFRCGDDVKVLCGCVPGRSRRGGRVGGKVEGEQRRDKNVD